MTDDETLKMHELIKKYKPDNYTTCSPEDTVFMNNYMREKFQQKDFTIYEIMKKVDPEISPANQDFDLHHHYKSMYQELGLKDFPTYGDKKVSYSYNVKNVYNSNKDVADLSGEERLKSIFKKISNPEKGDTNKALKDLSDHYNIVFKVTEKDSFDGECRFQKLNPQDDKESVIISITQGAMNANDDALAVLLGHELSHGVDISKRPNNYIGSIGEEAPEDFANIVGSHIAQNAGYHPAEFIKAQGTNNKKTQRAADMITQYVMPPKSKTDRIKELRGLSTSQPSHKSPQASTINVKQLQTLQKNLIRE